MLKSFSMILNETREAAASVAAAHHARAEDHKRAAEGHAEGSSEFHKAMAQHHHAKMMAHRHEAKSKWKVADKSKDIKAADAHFSKSMAHHLAAQNQ